MTRVWFLAMVILNFYNVSNSMADASLDSNMAEMIRAPDLVHLKMKLQEIKGFEVLRAKCEIQLKFELLPEACFGVIQFEKRKKLISEGTYLKTKLWLNQNCLIRVNQLNIKISEQSDILRLPADCREIAMNKRSDQTYKDVTLSPNALFRRRL